MTHMIARALMRLAVRAMGRRRGSWAAAMVGEFDAATADGHPLAFAFGCLIGALRDLPAHREGRFAMASHAAALGLLLPTAALLLASGLAGYPYLAAPTAELGAIFPGQQGRVLLLNAGNLSAAPSLSLLVLLLCAVHCPIAWWLLDRDWQRLGAAARVGAAAMAALVTAGAATALGTAAMVVPLLWITIELLIVWLLAEWHRQHIEPYIDACA